MLKFNLFLIFITKLFIAIVLVKSTISDTTAYISTNGSVIIVFYIKKYYLFSILFRNKINL